MKVVVALVGFIVLAACTNGATAGGGPSPSVSPSSSSSPKPSPFEPPFSTTLNCNRPVTNTRGLALFEYTNSNVIGIVDVSDPLKPTFLCLLSLAQGGRFVQSANKVVFWVGDRLGSADLTSGKVVQTAQLPVTPFEGSFSRDGSMFAYRSSDSAGRMSTHVFGGGYGRTLYTQEALGGVGGPPSGPVNQLEFSPDGSELLDYWALRPPSGPDVFQVYRTNGILSSSAPSDSFRILHLTKGQSGVWSPTGHLLYFYGAGPDPSAGKLYSFDASGQTLTVASGLSSMLWSRMSPDGGSVVDDTKISTGPNDACGGLPHLSRLDLSTGQAAQLSSAISSEPMFMSPAVVWSDEERPSQCGPGGESAPDGVILAHNLVDGSLKTVDMSQSVPGVGAPRPSTSEVVDVWL